jgi:hypothetical protein
MTRRSKGIRAVFVFGLTCLFTIGALDHAQAQTSSPGDGKSVRAAKPAGVILRGNRLRAKPGFVFERGFNNQLIARRAGGGGGLGSTASCSCSKEGNCEWSASGDVAICAKSTNLPCNGSCEWGFTASGFGGGVIAR